ncbi:hypothetical protein [Streptomyces sp. BF23-19]|uniref:hypothetical protein n=1 Tax=unclassified Streptomyces TaxID=2593676 RepID=UPI0034E60BA4
MGVQENLRPDGPRRETGGRAAGLSMPQAVVISVILISAVVLRLYGMPAGEAFRMLAGAAGLGVVVVLAPAVRGSVAAMVRAAVQSGR